MKGLEIKAVFFDLDGVLNDYTSWVNKAINKIWESCHSKIDGVDLERFRSVYWEIFLDMENQYKKGNITLERLQNRESRFSLVLNKLNIKTPGLANDMKRIYDQLRGKDPVIFKGCKENLIMLKEARVFLSLVTQGKGETQRNQIARLGISDLFDDVVVSDEIKFYKPDPQFYLCALNRANVHPRQSIMVGDRIDWDIAPAKSVGMHTILFTENSLYLYPSFEKHPAIDFIARDHFELRQILTNNFNLKINAKEKSDN